MKCTKYKKDGRCAGILAGAAVLALPVAAAAADGVQATRTSPVVVTGTRVETNSFDLPLAVDVVDQDSIRAGKAQVNVSEVLNQVPGTNVQNRENFAQELQISIRGFGARSQFGTRGVRLFVDDIPASTPDGQGGPGAIDLGSAERIEVLRGAFSALYGNHSGGVVRAFTADGPTPPAGSVSLMGGSYDTWRAQVQAGGQSGNANYTASISRYDTDGYRDHGSARKDQFSGKVSYAYGQGSKFTVTGGWYDIPLAEDPLGLDAAAVAQNPRQAIASAYQFNTRRSLDNTQLGAVVEHNLSATDQLSAVGYVAQRGNVQYLPFSGNFGLSSGGVSAIDRDAYGGSLRWTHKAAAQQSPFTFTAGLDYDTAKDDRKGYENNNGIQGLLRRDEENTVDGWGAYAQGDWQLNRDWSVFGGMRYTKVEFDSTDACVNPAGARCAGAGGPANPNDSGSISYSDWTPVAGVLWKFSPMVNLYANAGRSFETPTSIELAYRPDGGSGLNFGLKPSISNQYEVGAKAFVTAASRVNAALFYIDTKDEIVIATNQGGRSTFQNAPGSERIGVELSFDGDLGNGFTGYAAFTYLDASYTDPFLTCAASPCNTLTGVGTALVADGNRVPGVAKDQGYAELKWRHAPYGLTTALEGQWSGKVPVNDLNTEYAGSYAIMNWWAGLEQKVSGWRLKEFVRVNNMFDKKYIGAVIVGDLNGRFYAPAPERNFLVGVTVGHDF